MTRLRFSVVLISFVFIVGIHINVNADIISANGFSCSQNSSLDKPGVILQCEGNFERMMSPNGVSVMSGLLYKDVAFVAVAAYGIDKITGKLAQFLYGTNDGCVIIKTCSDDKCKNFTAMEVVSKNGKTHKIPETSSGDFNMKKMEKYCKR